MQRGRSHFQWNHTASLMAWVSGLVTDQPPAPDDLHPHYTDHDHDKPHDFTMSMSAALGGLAKALKK